MTAYDRRLLRGSAIQRLGGHIIAAGLGWKVQSQATHEEYDVSVEIDDKLGWLLNTSCSCKDFEWLTSEARERPRTDNSMINGLPVCKHIFAVLIETGWIEPAKGTE